MKRPVANISNRSRSLATFASDVGDHSQRLAKVANLRFALLRVQFKRTLRWSIASDLCTAIFPPLSVVLSLDDVPKTVFLVIQYGGTAAVRGAQPLDPPP